MAMTRILPTLCVLSAFLPANAHADTVANDRPIKPISFKGLAFGVTFRF